MRVLFMSRLRTLSSRLAESEFFLACLGDGGGKGDGDDGEHFVIDANSFNTGCGDGIMYVLVRLLAQQSRMWKAEWKCSSTFRILVL